MLQDYEKNSFIDYEVYCESGWIMMIAAEDNQNICSVFIGKKCQCVPVILKQMQYLMEKQGTVLHLCYWGGDRIFQ